MPHPTDSPVLGTVPERWILRVSTPPWLAAIFFAVVAPVVVIGTLGYHQLYGSLTEMAFERRQSLAHLSALALVSRLDSLTEVGLSLSSRVQFRNRIAEGEWEEAIRLLEEAPSDLPYLERMFLADPEGNLRADHPALPGVRGENFAFRDWYRGVSAKWAPYISETYIRAAPPEERVVAAAIPVRPDGTGLEGEPGEPIGILVLQIGVDTLVDWSGEVPHGPSGFVYFVDQRGRVVTHPKPDGEDGEDLSEVPAVEKVLRGERGVMEIPCPFGDEPTLAAYAPVPDHGWGVIAQQPVREAFRGRDAALRAFLLRNGGILLLSAVLGGFVVAGLGALRRYALEVSDLYNHAPCGYHSLDKDGVFRRVNGTELGWLGYEAKEILGRMKFSDLLTKEGVASFRENFPRLQDTGEVSGLQFELVRKDGSTFPVLLNATAVRDTGGAFVMSRSTLFDMSELKSAQDALKAANAELEAFSYSVSHDLRAPLRGIDGFSLALAEDCSEKLSPGERDHLARIRSATQRMGRLIDDLLNLSRVSRTPMAIESVDLSAMAHRILDDFREEEPQRRVEAVVAEGLRAEGDPRLLHVVLQNLLGNAWKFTSRSENARIEFGGGVAEAGGKGAGFFVRDNGAGFDMKYADKLFGAFQRLHGDSEFPGTGIGLATVQRILRRHGGWIRAEAALGKGACFHFMIRAVAPTDADLP